MKKYLFAAAVLLSGASAYAAAPEGVTKALADCCSAFAACCDAVMACCG